VQPLLLALALGQAAPAQAPAAAPRDVTVLRRADGTFEATLDGQPVAGADFYRAVLRFDLAERYDAASDRKRALAVAAVAAPLAGLTAGWIYAAVSEHVPPSCAAIVPEPPNCQQLVQQNEQWNQQHLKQGLVVGGLAGLTAGVVLGWLSWRVELPEPTAEEAEALVRRYRERNGLPGPLPGPGTAPGGGAGPSGAVGLAPLPGGALLTLAGRF
jgi:tetrahydromethanopterin S-methyltransferase subunit F